MRYVALLRAVNVGGSGKLPMARLREIADGIGLLGPRTYLQSGNLVFDAPDAAAPGELTARLEQALEQEMGQRCAVVLLSGAQLAEVIERNPFAGKRTEPRQLHVLFRVLADDGPGGATDGRAGPGPGPGRPAAPDPGEGLDRDSFLPEEWAVIGPHVYLYLPDGIGRSKLAAQLTRRAGEGTARNWRTIEALAQMTAGA